MSRSSRLALLIGSPLALIVLVALSFAPLVRSQVANKASALGVLIDVQSVRPDFFAIRLHQVQLRIPEVSALEVVIDNVLVHPDRSVVLRGGHVLVRGSPAELAEQVRAWRAGRPRASTSEQPSSSSPSISGSDLNFTWVGFDGDQTQIRLLQVAVEDLLHPRSLRASQAEMRHPRVDFEASELGLHWQSASEPLLRALTAASIRATVRLGKPPVEKEAPPSADKRPAVRDRLAAVAALVAARLDPQIRVHADGAQVELMRGDEHITLGPGTLDMEQREGRIEVALAPGGPEQPSGVTFRASVPVGPGDVVMEAAGGPIRLSALGVRDGDLGLRRVKDASLQVDAKVTLHADGARMLFDGLVQAKGLSIAHPKLAEDPVEGLVGAAKLRGEARLDGTWVRLDEAELDIGAVRLQVHGVLERTPDQLRVDGRFAMPLVACQEFLDALPATLIPVVHGMRAAGTMSLKGMIRADTKSIDDFKMDYEAANDCRILSVPADVDVRRFSGAFHRTVQNASGKPVQIELGPGAATWTSLGGVSAFMETAVMTTEDARFRRHNGFDHEAIRNSIRENIRAGKFVRGASTISMQVAKNLYLSSSKTLSRKLQELILTAYLEQALTKDQIMSLYLNVIEFGPMCYGIGPAAWQYFRVSPSELSLSQSMYLASILPNPNRQHFAAGGRVSDGWMSYLYKLMHNAERRRWITTEDLDEGLQEWVVYGSPEPARMGPAAGEGGEPDVADEVFPEGI